MCVKWYLIVEFTPLCSDLWFARPCKHFFFACGHKVKLFCRGHGREMARGKSLSSWFWCAFLPTPVVRLPLAWEKPTGAHPPAGLAGSPARKFPSHQPQPNSCGLPLVWGTSGTLLAFGSYSRTLSKEVWISILGWGSPFTNLFLPWILSLSLEIATVPYLSYCCIICNIFYPF